MTSKVQQEMAPRDVSPEKSSPQHTPGPWKVYNELRFTEIARESGERLLMVGRAYRSGVANGTRYYMPSDANARLIAAAPDLLSIVKQYVKEIEDNGDEHYASPACRDCTGMAPEANRYCLYHRAKRLLRQVGGQDGK